MFLEPFLAFVPVKTLFEINIILMGLKYKKAAAGGARSQRDFRTNCIMMNILSVGISQREPWRGSGLPLRVDLAEPGIERPSGLVTITGIIFRCNWHFTNLHLRIPAIPVFVLPMIMLLQVQTRFNLFSMNFMLYFAKKYTLYTRIMFVVIVCVCKFTDQNTPRQSSN